MEWKWNGKWNGTFLELLKRMESGMEWNGMESGKENFYSCYVEQKKNGMESGMEMEWNNLRK